MNKCLGLETVEWVMDFFNTKILKLNNLKLGYFFSFWGGGIVNLMRMRERYNPTNSNCCLSES